MKVTSVNAEQTSYGVMKKIAQQLEIEFNGKSKAELAAEINAEIEKRGGEIEMNEVEQTVSNEAGETVENEMENTGAESGEETATEAPATKAKWYEAEGYGNQPGDRITIIGKHIHTNTPNPKVILQGRTAVVVGPSRKANMIQARLIDDKTGNEQGCIITLAFGEYANEGTVTVEKPERKTRKKKEQPAVEAAAPESKETESDEQQAS